MVDFFKIALRFYLEIGDQETCFFLIASCVQHLLKKRFFEIACGKVFGQLELVTLLLEKHKGRQLSETLFTGTCHADEHGVGARKH